MDTTTFTPFTYHNQFCKELAMLLYHNDTVDVGYNYQVDNTMNHVVHGNNWLNLMLNENAY